VVGCLNHNLQNFRISRMVLGGAFG